MRWLLPFLACCCMLASAIPASQNTNSEGTEGEAQGSPEAPTTSTLEELTSARQAQQVATTSEDQNVAQNEVSAAQEVEQTSLKPADEVTTPATITAKPTPATIVITRPPKPTKKPKPVKATTVAPTTTSTEAPGRFPCRCGGGLCSCCTGILLENFNVPIRSRACANVTYEPEEFAFNFKLAYNNRVLYSNRMSAKNPRPACVPINRYFGVKMCARLHNVYFSGRNVHACLDMQGFWDDEEAFNYSFNCFRIGNQGVAIVPPEEGGGLPPPPDEEEQIDEDYDDSARGWRGDSLQVPV